MYILNVLDIHTSIGIKLSDLNVIVNDVTTFRTSAKRDGIWHVYGSYISKDGFGKNTTLKKFDSSYKILKRKREIGKKSEIQPLKLTSTAGANNCTNNFNEIPFEHFNVELKASSFLIGFLAKWIARGPKIWLSGVNQEKQQHRWPELLIVKSWRTV